MLHSFDNAYSSSTSVWCKTDMRVQSKIFNISDVKLKLNTGLELSWTLCPLTFFIGHEV